MMNKSRRSLSNKSNLDESKTKFDLTSQKELKNDRSTSPKASNKSIIKKSDISVAYSKNSNSKILLDDEKIDNNDLENESFKKNSSHLFDVKHDQEEEIQL